VEQGTPNTNFGASTSLIVDTVAPTAESYLRFSVSGLAGPVRAATLRLYAFNGTGNGPAVYPAGNGWTEGGLTWNTKPARTSATPTDDKGAIAANAWVEYDVTPLVAGNGTYTFNLPPQSDDGAGFYSREHTDPALRPQLVLTVEQSGSTSTAVTQSALMAMPLVGNVAATNVWVMTAWEAGKPYAEMGVAGSALAFAMPRLVTSGPQGLGHARAIKLIRA
jgi:hypothetical protein